MCAGLAQVFDDPSPSRIHAAMVQLGKLGGCHMYRKELWRDAQNLFVEFERGVRQTLEETAIVVRNRQRVIGRGVDPRAVSRTLLIKGLEFDHALVPSAVEFSDAKRPGDGARHFYVAVTRASRTLTVLSDSDEVRFPPAAI
jgi:hypothetical protein